jgi:iron only hydrogenase large subunit-like protein
MEFKKNSKYLCMLAPSFISEWDYPDVVYRLRALGFDKVVELTFGAKMTNLSYYEILKNYQDRTWIASPCPTLVNIIRGKYPHLLRNLVPVHSPMGCMALIAKKHFPNHKIVFVGPCLTKKTEAQELGFIDEALTFKEIENLFDKQNIPENIDDSSYHMTYDKFYNDYTKIYPLSGGLSDTLQHHHILKKSEILVTDGMENIIKVLDGFKDGYYKKYKFLDILTCEGGCINGPGMIGKYPLKERHKRVLTYRDYARRYEHDLGRTGKKIHADGLDFSRKFE